MKKILLLYLIYVNVLFMNNSSIITFTPWQLKELLFKHKHDYIKEYTKIYKNLTREEIVNKIKETKMEYLEALNSTYNQSLHLENRKKCLLAMLLTKNEILFKLKWEYDYKK